MAALSAIGALGFFKNRRRRTDLMSKIANAAATVIAAREVLGSRSYAQVRPTRLGAWRAR